MDEMTIIHNAWLDRAYLVYEPFDPGENRIYYLIKFKIAIENDFLVFMLLPFMLVFMLAFHVFMLQFFGF